jgi:tetratricopeptide (TPR) repeat protein
VRAELGRHAEASADLELALRTADAQSRGEDLLVALRAAVYAAELSGATQPLLPHARRLAQLALRSGSPLWTLGASLTSGIAHASHARWDDAIGLLEQVVERIDERGFARHDLGRALTALAGAYLGAGRLDDAAKAGERAVRTARTAGLRSRECMARIVLARAQLAREGAAARRKVRAGLARIDALVRETGARGYRPFAAELRAELARAGGDASAAERELAKARRLFAELGASGHAERVARELEARRDP